MRNLIATRLSMMTFTILASYTGFSQSANSVVAVFTVPNENIPTSFDRNKNKMPNSVTVAPQLTDRLPKNSLLFDAFKIKDGMTCITPDPRTNLKLKVASGLGW